MQSRNREIDHIDISGHSVHKWNQTIYLSDTVIILETPKNAHIDNKRCKK